MPAFKPPCKGRMKSKCKQAPRSCRRTKGANRKSYCRKARNTRKKGKN